MVHLLKPSKAGTKTAVFFKIQYGVTFYGTIKAVNSRAAPGKYLLSFCESHAENGHYSR
jgi:hypothetical protein